MSNLEELRDRISAHRIKKQSNRLPVDLKHEVAKEFSVAKMPLLSFSKALGVSPSSVLNWTRRTPSTTEKFHRVQIVEDRKLDKLTVFGPEGIRIENLDLATVAALIQTLGGRSC